MLRARPWHLGLYEIPFSARVGVGCREGGLPDEVLSDGQSAGEALASPLMEGVSGHTGGCRVLAPMSAAMWRVSASFPRGTVSGGRLAGCRGRMACSQLSPPRPSPPQGHSKSIQCLTVHKNGGKSYIYSGSHDGHINILWLTELAPGPLAGEVGVFCPHGARGQACQVAAAGLRPPGVSTLGAPGSRLQP